MTSGIKYIKSNKKIYSALLVLTVCGWLDVTNNMVEGSIFITVCVDTVVGTVNNTDVLTKGDPVLHFEFGVET